VRPFTLLILFSTQCLPHAGTSPLCRASAGPKKRFNAEQIVTLLRQIEVLMAQGEFAPEACRDAGISQQSFYRWRKEYGGLVIDLAKRTKDLERENAHLKRLVADLSLEKQVLKDIASGNL
jgi:putative transposase